MADWDKRFLELAEHVSQWSKDPSTKVGAVLVGANRHQIAVGYNGFPPGIEDSEERLSDRQVKYSLMIHAERNVLDHASFNPEGGIIYASKFPCLECSKSIISRKIEWVISREETDVGMIARWERSWEEARFILNEAGVRVALI